MSNLKETVENIRKFISENAAALQNGVPSQLAEEDRIFLAGLATDYAAATQDLNERAAACQDLSRKGLRADALDLAKGPPDLRELSRQVAFTDSGIWLDFCDQYSLPIPYVVDQEMVSAVINEVYGLSKTRDQLLQLHRQMAIGKAPLADRLRVLRALCKADPVSETWREDAARFETARIEELIARAHDADKAADLPVLQSIYKELRSPDWLEPPPASALKNLLRRIRPHQESYAHDRYRELAEHLRDAHGAMDESRARDLLEQWDQVATVTKVPPDDCHQDIEPIREWLDDLARESAEETQFHQACATLDKALDDGKPRDQLERSAAAILNCERGMPELLELRYHARIDQIRRRERRSFILKLVAVFVIVIALGAVATVTIRHYRRQKEIDQWYANIDTALNEDRLDDAQELLEKLRQDRPDLADRAEFQPLSQKHQQLVAKTAAREQQFAALIEQVELAGVENPDRNALRKAAEIADGVEERGILQDWRERIATHEASVRRQQLVAIGTQMKELEDLARRLATEDAPAAVDQLANSCFAKAGQIARMPGLTDRHRSRLTAIQTEAIERKALAAERIRGRTELARAFSALQTSVADDATYMRLLRNFCERNTGHALTSDFKKSLSNLEKWAPIGAWQAVLPDGPLVVNDGPTASSLKVAVENYLREYTSGPRSELAGKCLAYLDAAQKALNRRDQLFLSALKRKLQTRDFRLEVMAVPNGAVYYLEAGSSPVPYPTEDNPGQYIIKVYDGPDKVAREEKPAAKRVAGFTVTDSPQKVFAAEAIELIEALKKSNYEGWEHLYLDLVDQAIRSDMDRILCAALVEDLLLKAISTTPFVDQDLAIMQDGIASLYVSSIPWWRHDDDNVENQRISCENELMNCDISLARSLLTKQLDEMRSQCVKYMPVGLIDADREVLLNGTVDDGTLHVFTPVPHGASGSARNFRLIGRIEGGAIQVRSSDLANRPIGSRVYLLKDIAQGP